MVAACNPSSGLLLRRAEHSAGRGDATDRQAGYPDEPVPEAGALVLRPEGERRLELYAWGAWDDVHPDARAVAAHPYRVPAVVDAGKSADQEPDGPERGAWFRSALLPARWARELRGAAEEPCKLDAGRSGAQSCAAQEAAVWLAPQVEPGLMLQSEAAKQQARWRQQPSARQSERAAELQPREEQEPAAGLLWVWVRAERRPAFPRQERTARC